MFVAETSITIVDTKQRKNDNHCLLSDTVHSQ
jgi:hypothetical protein